MHTKNHTFYSYFPHIEFGAWSLKPIYVIRSQLSQHVSNMESPWSNTLDVQSSCNVQKAKTECSIPIEQTIVICTPICIVVNKKSKKAEITDVLITEELIGLTKRLSLVQLLQVRDHAFSVCQTSRKGGSASVENHPPTCWSFTRGRARLGHLSSVGLGESPRNLSVSPPFEGQDLGPPAGVRSLMTGES